MLLSAVSLVELPAPPGLSAMVASFMLQTGGVAKVPSIAAARKKAAMLWQTRTKATLSETNC